MHKLLIATNNPGKVREFAELFDGLPARLVTPTEVGLRLEVEEHGRTYSENARLKALAFARASGLLTVADDSGLEVAALGGAPGLHSARYAGPGASDLDRRRKLMQELSQTAAPRPARFYCVLAVAASAADVRLFEGECRGEILLEERGQNGFGYDPLFYLPEYGRTMAELPRELKNQLSHRGRAVQAAWPALLQLLSAG